MHNYYYPGEDDNLTFDDDYVDDSESFDEYLLEEDFFSDDK